MKMLTRNPQLLPLLTGTRQLVRLPWSHPSYAHISHTVHHTSLPGPVSPTLSSLSAYASRTIEPPLFLWSCISTCDLCTKP